MKTRIDLLHTWTVQREAGRTELRFPVPEHAAGLTPWGFDRLSDSAENLLDWYGLQLTLQRAEDGADTLSVTAHYADGSPRTAKLPILFRDGKAAVTLPLSDFPIETARDNLWRFTDGFTVETGSGMAELTACVACRRPAVYLDFPVRGKSGEAGEMVAYEGQVWNCGDGSAVLTADQVYEGWESMNASIQMEKTMLAPGEGCGITVSVAVHRDIPPGGHENTVIRVRTQAGEDTAALKTLRRLPHPYIYHTLDDWANVRENILRYEPYHAPTKSVRDRAEAWTVTDPMEGRDFCYELKNEDGLMCTAYLYALSGDLRYAEKLADFFRRFCNPVSGYPARKRGCSASYVQEGHFFKHLSIAWDILQSSPVCTEEDRTAMEGVFRQYMEILDIHIRNGHISNWILSELQGALYAALAIQDIERAERFAFGPGGIVEQFRKGILNDGWWHECSVGYNTWVSSILIHVSRSLIPFGYDLTHMSFPVPYNQEVDASYRCQPTQAKFGMLNRKWGGNSRPAVRIKDMFDAPLRALDWRGVLFGIADSDEKRLTGIHFGSTYDLAYHYYQDPAYLPLIARNEPDPFFGTPEVHQLALRQAAAQEQVPLKGTHADNIGIAVLRSQASDRTAREQIQAVLRYGSHGGAHGHFDIADLLSVMRYGRSFFNPENCWWGYAHFLYKFYVQCSLTKNMVVVDRKMQDPADSRLILWQEGEHLQAAGVEVCTRWSYPPYGGMVYEQDGQADTKEDLLKRCQMNHCWLPIQDGPDSPRYGERTGFTEPILQRRVLALTNDYLILFDYLSGETTHRWDSLMQIKGFQGIQGASFLRHTEQMDPNPISDTQFITDCNWYTAKDGTTARFCTLFTEDDAGELLRGDRSNWNDPGILHMDVHTAWPRETEQMVGRVAVYYGWAADGNGYTIPLAWRLELDGETAASGAFDGWVLGRGEIAQDLRGMHTAVLALRQGCSANELGNPVETPQGVFWGEVILQLESGERINLGQLMAEGRASFVSSENLDLSCGIGRDYQGGRVTIVGTEYPYSIPASPADHGAESKLILDLTGLGAVSLQACVGVDAFPGDESQHRMTYAVGTEGKDCRYVTVVEPYETVSVIDHVAAEGPDAVRVYRKDGRIQTIRLSGMIEGRPEVSMEEY